MTKPAITAAFNLLDHTGDTGLLLQAPSLSELFRQAALGFNAVLFEQPESIVICDETELVLTGRNYEELLVNWLSELNYHFAVLGKVYRDFLLQLQSDQLQARLSGELFDPDRHPVAREIKAITFHQLEIRQLELESWQGRVIFDI